MKKLIINADDLGADEARNAGIFEGIQAGIVTSVSILSNGPAFGDALERIRSGSFRGVSWGVHLNLSEGKPILTGASPLLGQDGLFRGKASTQQLLMRGGNGDLENAIAREIEAQIALLEESGILLRHLDGHQHVHVFPAVLRTAFQAAQKHHIPWIRIPDEPEPTPSDNTSPLWLRKEANLFSWLGGTARSTLSETEMRTTDHFRGLYLKGRLSVPGLEALLRQLPDGLTEIMVHPGFPHDLDRGQTRLLDSRRTELEALCDPVVKEAFGRHHVELVHYGQL